MKGAPGLIVAVFLGFLAVVVNWIYLDSKTRDVDNVSFLGIRDGTEIRFGEPFKRNHFVEVKIPERHARSLKDFVYLYKDLNTVVGALATQVYNGGELVYRSDYITPSRQLELEKNEILFWISVDPRSVVPELIIPGDRVTFHFPNFVRAANSVVSENVSGAPPEARLSSGNVLDIGPFRVKALGNRLGRVDVMKANRQSPAQEQKIGIVVDETNAEDVARFDKLKGRVLTGDYRNIGVTLHSRK